MIVDAETLRALCGFKQKLRVAKWCKKNGIKYFRDAKGWPVTTQSALDRALTPSVESGTDWSPYHAKQKTPAESP